MLSTEVWLGCWLLCRSVCVLTGDISALQRFSFSFSADAALNTFLSVAIILMIAGGFLVLLSVLGVLTVRGKSCRIPMALMFMVTAVVVSGVLILVAVVMVMLSKGKAPLGIEGALRRAWRETVARRPSSACKIQTDYDCFGFSDSFCVGCGAFNESSIRDCPAEQAPMCPICEHTLPNTTKGCYRSILEHTSNFQLPVGVSSAVVAGFVLLDSLAVCGIIR